MQREVIGGLRGSFSSCFYGQRLDGDRDSARCMS